jgi:hypothetical protein
VAWWILHVLGVDNLSGPWYGFWSGIGSDITEFAIVGGIFSLYWKHTCHVQRCWRLGRHPVENTGYVVCRRHHPNGAPTHEDVLAASRPIRRDHS